MSVGPKRESRVELGDRELVVVSEVILDPETMIVTRVLEGDAVVEKTHVVLPSAVVADHAERGTRALEPTLNLHHLRFLNRLVTGAPAERDERAGAAPAGVLASLVLGASGEKLSGAGEDQVPGQWLRAAWMVARLGRDLEATLDAGPACGAQALGRELGLHLVPDGERTRVCFVEPGRLDRGALATHLGGM